MRGAYHCLPVQKDPKGSKAARCFFPKDFPSGQLRRRRKAPRPRLSTQNLESVGEAGGPGHLTLFGAIWSEPPLTRAPRLRRVRRVQEPVGGANGAGRRHQPRTKSGEEWAGRPDAHVLEVTCESARKSSATAIPQEMHLWGGGGGGMKPCT